MNKEEKQKIVIEFLKWMWDVGILNAKEYWELLQDNLNIQNLEEIKKEQVCNCGLKTEIEEDSWTCYINWIFNWDSFKEEKPKLPVPAFKIGQYLVKENKSSNEYFKLIGIWYDNEEKEFSYNWYIEKSIRKPTQEELKLYFR